MPASPFPIEPPIEPMLAKLADELPTGDDFLYEPKWDGFRAIVFRGGGDVFIQSRDLRPLDRYFPELHEALLARPARRLRARRRDRHRRRRTASTSTRCSCACIRRRRAWRSSRRRRPPSFVAFDAARGRRRAICATRRRASAARALERLLADVEPPLHLTPMTRDRAQARRVAGALRRRGPRRRDRQAGGRHLSARQARDAQGQARAHRRLRRRRLPLAQGREGRARRLAAARALRRRRRAASRRRHLVVHDGAAHGSSRRSWRRCASDALDGASVARVGRGASDGDDAHAGRRRAAGAPARICRGSRCASSASAR